MALAGFRILPSIIEWPPRLQQINSFTTANLIFDEFKLSEQIDANKLNSDNFNSYTFKNKIIFKNVYFNYDSSVLPVLQIPLNNKNKITDSFSESGSGKVAILNILLATSAK